LTKESHKIFFIDFIDPQRGKRESNFSKFTLIKKDTITKKYITEQNKTCCLSTCVSTRYLQKRFSAHGESAVRRERERSRKGYRRTTGGNRILGKETQ